MRFGIVGDPVMHSRSPVIHTAGFAARGIDATYAFLPTALNDFGEIEDRLRSGELDGVSVTMPHKTNAYLAVDVRTDIAERTGAVNTITSIDGLLSGTNTDVAGVRFAMDLAGAITGPVLVLGAGGAATAALVALEGRDLFVSSRDVREAIAALKRTKARGTAVPWGEGVAGATVVNATPLGMHGESLPSGPLGVASAVVDMAYGEAQTRAISYAKANGLGHADGLDMLVGQAIEAFEIFTHTEAPVDTFHRAARAD